MTGQFLNIREGLSSKAKLVPANTKLESVIKNANKDYYVSLYTYNDSHKKILEETGTLAGIENTQTNRLFFDFDDKSNVENAKQDTIITANRLLERGIDEQAIKVYFTGGKGFSIEVFIDEYINPSRFGAIVDSVAGDLQSFDTVVREANRIVRIPNTKHQNEETRSISEDFILSYSNRCDIYSIVEGLDNLIEYEENEECDCEE